jgi:hypothetical protein
LGIGIISIHSTNYYTLIYYASRNWQGEKTEERSDFNSETAIRKGG